MSRIRSFTTTLCLLLTALLVASPATAQQVTGTLGSPSATTSISAKQLPAPDPAFGGVIRTTRCSRRPGGRRASCHRRVRRTCC